MSWYVRDKKKIERRPRGNWRPIDIDVVNRRTGEVVKGWARTRWRPSSTELVARAAVCLSEVVSRHQGTYNGDGGIPDLVACMEDLLIDIERYFSRHERTIWINSAKKTRWRDRYRLPEVMAAHRRRMRSKKLAQRFMDADAET